MRFIININVGKDVLLFNAEADCYKVSLEMFNKCKQLLV